jgi:hypothetical protein
MVLEQLTRPELSGPESIAPELSATVPAECGYRNASDRMIILRCIGPDRFFLERVVFPFELLTFQCPRDSEVEIWTHGLGGPELLESIESRELRMDPEPIGGAAGPYLEASPWLPLH